MQPFVSALGTELGLTSKEIADIIWLALQMQESDGAKTVTQLEPSTPARGTEERSHPFPTHSPSRSDQDAKPDRDSSTKSAEVHLKQPNANQTSFGKQLALKVPDARSLREPLSLARSLKPLLRRVVTGWSTVLDEAATVERIADEQLWFPVLKPALEPWLDLALVVDESVSMQIWQRTIAELQRLLSHYGVFRDVRMWGLVANEQRQVQLRPGIGAAARRQAARRQAARRPSELIDPSGRRLVLVATDCVSSGWQDGSFLPVLKLWARSGPLVIVQMLPEWLWSRTSLGFASAVRLQSLLPGVPNQQLIATNLSPWDEVDLEAGIKVPVVTLEPEPFATWTEMVTGKGRAWSPGFVFEEAIAPNMPVAQLPDVAAESGVQPRVQRFRVTASPMARRLAGLLAAAPVISLPVVRIIQDQLLSDSQQVHVAEVFLGGLLKPLGEVEIGTNSDAVQYDFLDGLREALLGSVPTSASVSVVEEVSKFVAQRLGLSLDEFAVVLRNPQQAEDRELIDQSRPFAMMTAQILRQLGGEYVKFAEELEDTYRSGEEYFSEIQRVSEPDSLAVEQAIESYPNDETVECQVTIFNERGKSPASAIYKLPYLDRSGADELIVNPIRIPDTSESRYRGNAVNRLIELTAGNPYYIQIFCDRLVKYMNRKKAIYVTDADIDQVKKDLLSGNSSLRLPQFDNLIIASDNDVDEITKEDSEAVLRAIASGSRIQDNCDRNTINVATSISVDMVLNDLCKREVIDRKQETLFQIRVKLFKEWLLAN